MAISSDTQAWAKVASGFKGGPFFGKASARAPFTFVEGWPSESIQKYAPVQGGTNPTPTDSWNERRVRNK